MCAGESPGVAVAAAAAARRCHTVAPSNGPSAFTKRLLSVSPRSRPGSEGQDDPIPWAGTSARGDPLWRSRGCRSAEFCRQCSFTAAVRVPAGPRSPRGSVGSQNLRKPLFSTQHTKCSAVASPCWTMGLPANHLEF